MRGIVGRRAITSVRDWRLWVAVAVLAGVFAVDMLVPQMTVAPFFAVPVVAAATFAAPVMVGGLAAVAVGLDLLAGWIGEDWGSEDFWQRFAALVIVGLLATYVAHAAFESRRRLRESEERSRLLAENVSDVVMLLSADGVVAWASPSVRVVMGWRLEDVVGASLLEFLHTDDQSALGAELTRAVNEKGALTATEIRARRADGTFVWLSANGHEVDRQQAVVALRDVDAQVRDRISLERAEARYRRLTEDMQDVVWTLDVETLMFTYVSPSVFDLRGYTPGEVMATPMDAALTSEDSTRVRQLLSGRATRQSDGSIANDRYFVENVEQPCKDGSTVWTEVITHYAVDETTGALEVHGVSRNIAQRRAAEASLVASEARLRMIVEASSDVIMQDRDGVIEWVSPALTAALGWIPDQWVGKSLMEFVYSEDREAAQAGRNDLDEGTPAVFRVRLRDSDGGHRWVEFHTSSIAEATGGVSSFVSTFRNVDDVVDHELALWRRATLDDLTGAYKRDEGLRLLARGITTRRPGAQTAALFCDVDLFKEVNDARGHAIGDVVLSVVADRIRGRVRDGDVIVRMGGDEFLIILEGVHDLEEATMIAEEIRRSVSEPVDAGNHDVAVTVSIGVTLCSAGEDADSLVARADLAMYQAKRAGRNQVIVGVAEMR
jgi:diguanylate cyclase (GGDEF)-like protein/PAS domain S-box-containing protein